jgi:hypothetical protein
LTFPNSASDTRAVTTLAFGTSGVPWVLLLCHLHPPVVKLITVCKISSWFSHIHWTLYKELLFIISLDEWSQLINMLKDSKKMQLGGLLQAEVIVCNTKVGKH